jgi:serine kinase of HPr protein (carbohydrate metabolism regulator)
MSASAPAELIMQASGVVIGGRALLIEGPPGSGKSSLALALLDRGAGLIGDDAVRVLRDGGRVIAAPPPRIAGLIELRGIGIVRWPTASPAPIALILTLGGPVGERLPARAATRDILGLAIPVLAFEPGTLAPAQRAEWALHVHGLASAASHPA